MKTPVLSARFPNVVKRSTSRTRRNKPKGLNRTRNIDEGFEHAQKMVWSFGGVWCLSIVGKFEVLWCCTAEMVRDHPRRWRFCSKDFFIAQIIISSITGRISWWTMRMKSSAYLPTSLSSWTLIMLSMLLLMLQDGQTDRQSNWLTYFVA